VTTDERRQSLAAARRACEWLNSYISIYSPHREEIECLITEFTRLDAKEQLQAVAGRAAGHMGAEYGRLGGRPKKAAKKTEEEMTPRERVNALEAEWAKHADWTSRKDAIEQAINAAVEEEREACARLLEAAAETGQIGEYLLPEMAAKIRARSTASTHSSEERK